MWNERPEPITAPTREGLLPFPGPCIVFGMSDEDYHNVHAASSSGLKDLMVCAGDYWESSVLNPDREDEDSSFLRLGRAYHVRVLMGREVFERCYAPELVASDFGEAKVHKTVKDIRAAIIEAGGQPKGTDKTRLSEQLLEFMPDAILWDLEVAAWAERNKDKELLARKDYERIEMSAHMIEAAELLASGYSEVAFFWIDKETGVPCKAKLDKLMMNGFGDLKTFSSKAARPVQRAVDFEIANQKHYLQVAFYHRAVEALKKLVKETGGACIMEATPEGLIKSDQPQGLKGWVWTWAHQEECEALYVYVRTTGAPVMIPRMMLRGSVYEIARIHMVRLLKVWREMASTYGANRWLDVETLRPTVDGDLPLSASDFGEM